MQNILKNKTMQKLISIILLIILIFQFACPYIVFAEEDFNPLIIEQDGKKYISVDVYGYIDEYEVLYIDEANKKVYFQVDDSNVGIWANGEWTGEYDTSTFKPWNWKETMSHAVLERDTGKKLKNGQYIEEYDQKESRYADLFSTDWSGDAYWSFNKKEPYGIYDWKYIGQITTDSDEKNVKTFVDKLNSKMKELENTGLTLIDALNQAVDYAIDGTQSSVDDAYNEEQEDLLNQYEGEGESANLGGIILTPVIALFNFVADAVLGGVDNIMNGRPLITFDGVMQKDPPQNNYDARKAQTYEVDLNSFLPFNVVTGTVEAIKGEENPNFTHKYPHITYSPEEIFSGKIELLSIDFITGKNYKGEENKSQSNIRKVISQWYNVLRMISIIGLLSVLIYTGIKIIISSNAKDKAKYKEWIKNWFIAVGLLFGMHFIMALIVTIINELSGLLVESFQGIHVKLSNGKEFYTNLIGLVRFMVQTQNLYMKIGYEVMYIALICYTIKFTITYFKRVLNMAFLTLIAPVVALTYPIDKINDGTAQGFDMWLKEYIFNALLQPMHCILYYVLVGASVGIAAKNPIYGIAVLLFMTQAEKLLKKIFGFERAGRTSTTQGDITKAFVAGTITSSVIKMTKQLGVGSGRKR